MVTKLNVEKRVATTRSQLNQIRAEGKIPAVIYGKEIEATPLAISEREFLQLIKGDPNVIIRMDVPDEGEKSAMVHNIQRDAIKQNILHVDFLQIDLKDKINATVRIAYEGDPAGVREGGVQQIEMHEVEVQCLPTDIPAQISVDVSELQIGDSLTAGQLTMPEGVELVTAPEQVLMNILPPQASGEAVEEASEEADAGDATQSNEGENAEE